jgi:oligopeptidase A
VLDATKAFKKLVTDPKVVEGLPPSALALASQQAAATPGNEGATPEKGPWLLTLDIPVYMPVLQHARDRGLREEMYRAYVTRASSPKKKEEGKEEAEEKKDAVVGADGDNTAIIERVLSLRKQKAALLGFDCFAELSMASKMATLESSRALLEKLAAAARAPAERELEEVTAFARSKGFPQDEQLKHWDVSFWAERLREERYELTDEQLRPYFSLPRVLEGLFTLVERLFNVKIEETPQVSKREGEGGRKKEGGRKEGKESVSLDKKKLTKKLSKKKKLLPQGTAPTWNKDVRFLKVSSKATGKPIAFMFLDPYSRPDEKRGGAWMDEVVGRSVACAGGGEDGRVRLPVAHMVLNSTPPVGDKPSLMTFREVRVFCLFFFLFWFWFWKFRRREEGRRRERAHSK